MVERILVSDVGSTTTKLLLLEHDGHVFRSLGSRSVGTTVEKPVEDVCEGFFKGVEQLSRDTGVSLLNESGELSVPFHTTSSAGGGLQILVIALASSDSGAIAGTVAYTAGGVILESFAIDDNLPRVEKIRRMKHLSPDLVVMAGGYEDGAVAGVVNMAQLVAIAHPKPKYGGGKLPMVFCGNTKARPFISGMLQEQFSIHFADNIRPDGLNFNLKPSVTEVHRLFMDHVMQMAPGYARLAAMTSSPIIPTPAGVERILSLYSKKVSGDVVVADMGGATTDIFSHIKGHFQRTVAANTGMSYSLSNILHEAGRERVFAHIPHIDSETAGNWVLSKTLFPTTNPECNTSKAVEGAAAAEGMRLAWRHHLEISYISQRVGFTERVRTLGRCKFDEAFKTVHDDKFKVSEIAVLIGAGGIMACSDPRRVAWILVSGFRPKGITLLMVDKHFQSPHMGVLSEKYPEEALKYWEEECLKPVGRVYAPLNKQRKLQVATPSGILTVKSGEVLYLENSEGISIPGLDLPEDRLPLIIDLRFGDELIPMDFRREDNVQYDSIQFPTRETPDPEAGDVCREFTLSYPGEVKVNPGDAVSPGDVLGVNRLIPPRIYFVDVHSALGYNRTDLTVEAILKGITVSPGDRVSTGDKVFRMDKGSGITYRRSSVESPVRGIVTSITSPGLIIMKEIQDYDGKPHFVNVSRLLGVKPKKIAGYLKVRKGEFVQRGQIIAIGDSFKTIPSPTTGTVMNIDRKTGVVRIQYVLEPVSLYSPMSGTVNSVVPGLSAVLNSSGVTIPGVAGFGPVRWGALKTGEPEKNSIMLLNEPLSQSMVESFLEAGVSGVIAPSISSLTLVDFLGGDPGVILTGDEKIPFSVVILRGIGSCQLEKGVYTDLLKLEGSNCILFTTTRMRAGVERPMVLIQSESGED